ncbi:hypothetical protein D3C71_1414200 [compost metagenome]
MTFINTRLNHIAARFQDDNLELYSAWFDDVAEVLIQCLLDCIDGIGDSLNPGIENGDNRLILESHGGDDDVFTIAVPHVSLGIEDSHLVVFEQAWPALLILTFGQCSR